MPSAIGTDRGEPQSKRQRTSVGGNTIAGVEDEATAKRKLAAAGFDPSDCITATEPQEWPPRKFWRFITPMTYFCCHGDLPMCGYILNQGGSTTKAGTNSNYWFPMKAAIYKRNLEVVKFLFENGAKEDIRTRAHPKG